MRVISIAHLKLTGWRMQGDWPTIDKMVLVAAPHTSNWDGLQMLVAAGYYRIRLRWMGKKSLTTGPFGWIIKALGCVPIDRSQSHDVVSTMADAIEAADNMVLAIPPEGTRARVNEWKSGFHSTEHALVLYLTGRDAQDLPADVWFAVPPDDAANFVATPYVFQGHESARTPGDTIEAGGRTLREVKVTFDALY